MPSEEFQILKQQSLYSRLKRLFSTDVIVRNVGGKKLKIVDTDQVMYATDRNTLRDRFNRIRTSSFNQYSRDFTLSYQAARVELFRDYDCVGPDTIIPLPDGSRPTIAELTEKYKDKPKERFHVFSYDHETNSIKLGNAYHPRKKAGKRQGYKVTFDNGQNVVASLKHPFMMRDGTYKRTFELRVGDSVMPFYQREYGYNKHGFKRYRRLYNFSKGWQSEHKIVAEQFFRPLVKNEVIHHLDINGANNSPDNLLIMDWKEHKKHHSEYNKNVLWGDKNYETQLNKLKSHPNYINRNFHLWNGERAGENNPFYGKTHSEESNKLRSDTLKDVFKDRDQTGVKNPKYRGDVTFDNVKQKAYEYYKEYSKINLWDFIEHIKCDHSTLQNRLKTKGHDWKSFKKDVVSTLNHKIVSIEQIGEVDVYDVTVEKYENFATDSCFVKNTMDMDPILASALDIYADECVTKNELGKILTVTTDDNNIKQILENLFYDILNIEFFLWSWTRNLVKYGDFYLKLYISPEYGVYLAEPISSYSVTRVENSDINNKNYTKFQINLPEGGKIEDIENYQMAHFRLLSDSNFLPYGKCLVGETHVDTEFGSKYIKDLLVGEKIWSFNINNGLFELTSVKNKINSGVKETVKIRTQHNFIESSKNHPILTFNKITNKLEYKQTSDVKIGDLLLINANENKKSKISYVNIDLVGFNKNGWKNNVINLPNDIDCEFSELMGFMIGDGWLSGENTRVSFAIGKDDIQNKHYASILEKYSGKIGNWLSPKKNSGGQFYVDNKMLATVLFNNGLIGKAKTKRIPTWVFESSEDIQLAFIKGLTNADAWSFDDGFANRYTISLCNKDLIYDFKRLLQFNNIKSSIPIEDDTVSEVTICGVDCIKHGEYSINYYLDGNKKQQLKKYNYLDNSNILLELVVNIEFTGEKETWDIQVESENSNFVANGVVVHNSMIEGARRVWKQLSLMEDAMLIHRVIRAPEKRIFKIDVGNIPPQEVDQYIEKIINKTKKIPYIDPNTGDYNLRYNIQNLLEDFYLPVRGSDSGTSIEPLSGMEFTGIDDIEYLRNKMLAALKIPKAFLGYEEDLCLVPETVIPTLGGKDKTIKQLIEDYDNGIKNYVYSIDETTKNIVTGEVEWAGYTRKNAKLIRVHLDNSKYIDCTPDHNFMTRDGLWVEAQNLKPNQSLMPLYRKNEVLYGKSNYEMVYNPGLNSWEWTHKLVDNHTHGGNVSQPIPFNFDTMIVRHHKDFNRFNNDPTNIERVTNKNHKQIHNENVYKTFCSPEAIDYKKSKEFRDKKRNERLSYIKNNPHTKDKLKKNLAQYNLSNEELSIRCKNAWIEDDGTRLNKLVADNKKHNKSLRMIKALRIKKGFVNSLPTFEELVQFVKTNKIDNKKVIAKSLGCGYKYIENLIYSNGFNSIPEFYNEILGFKSGRTLSVRSQYYTELLNQYKSIDNIGITFGLSKNQIKSFSKKQTPILNHKVIKVEFLVETKDTCDLRITKYHNFATAAGVIVHNSGKATLASEDVRFAKTVNRIQKILVSELKKIAIVHLYAQGYTDESLVNFDLELTNPSVILEAEKVKIWSDKVALAKDMVENKLFSRKWIYNNVFKLADQDVDEQKNDIIEDAKDNYRFKQIEEEGIDPSKPFNKIKSDGESAESSSEGGGGSSEEGGGSSEEGGGSSDSGISGGEPIPKEVPQETPPAEPTLTEKSKRPSQAGEHKYRKDTRFGYDPMGNKENTRISKTDPLRSASKSKSPLSLENLTGLRAYLQSHAETKKDLLKEAPSKSLLDESNIIVDE